MIRFNRSVLTYAGLLVLVLPAACSGGGGSSSSGGAVLPPGTNPTPVSSVTSPSTSLQDCTHSASTQTALRKTLAAAPSAAVTAVPSASYQITSNPSGATVSNNSTTLGVTPYQFTPAAGTNVANLVQITSGGSSYSLCLAQSGFPSRTILFNAAGDTTGSIATVNSLSVARASLGAERADLNTLPVARRALRHAPTVSVDEHQLLVSYKAAALQNSNRSILSLENGAGISSAHTLGPQNGAKLTRVVRVPQGTTAQALTKSLLSDAAVESVSKVHYRSTLAVTPFTPNDPEFTKNELRQWDLLEIQAPSAWGITHGSPQVAIAIIDTGFDAANADLSSKVTFSESVIDGVTKTGTSASQDTDGHGTNVSGIAAAKTNNNLSVAGTGFDVALQEYRIFPNASDPNFNAATSGATATDEASAIYDAITRGAKVISLSIGGVAADGIDQAEYNAVEYAISQGVTVVSASGNERLSGVNTVDFPAAYPGVIAVGASALDDSGAVGVRASAREYVAPYSNAGPGLALVAPGGDPENPNDADLLHWILNLDTTTPASSTKCSDSANCLALFAGTSQATPHVAGAAALMYSLDSSLSPAQVRSILMNNADDINDPRQGAGRLNIYRALAAVANIAAPVAPNKANFVAFGYTNSGGTRPTIVDRTFPAGVPVNSDGTFRLPDIDPTVGSYRLAVWSDVNGNGIVDAGDYFGSGAVTCQATTSCNSSANGLTAGLVGNGFTLP